MSLAQYEELIAQLRAANVGEEAAHKAARIRYPDAAAQKAALAERQENVVEKDEQREVRKLLLAFGFRVYWLSQARVSGQTSGLPDLWFSHQRLPIAGWFEVKRQRGGRFSDAQKTFGEECQRCGIHYVAGDRHAARTFLITLGLTQIVGGTLEPIPRNAT
jgi:hypothetical protein